MISRSRVCMHVSARHRPGLRRKGRDGGRRLRTLWRRRRAGWGSHAQCADARERLAQLSVRFRRRGAASRARAPRTATRHTMSRPSGRDIAAATKPGSRCSSTTATAPGCVILRRLHADRDAEIGCERHVDRHLDAAHARRSTTRSRDNSTKRTRSSAVLSRTAKRIGRAKGSSRSTRLDPAGSRPPFCSLTPQDHSPRRSYSPVVGREHGRGHAVGIRLMFLVNRRYRSTHT